MPRKLRFELLDAVGEVRALPPDDLVAVGHVVEDTVVHRGAVVAEQPSLERYVP